MQQTLPRILVGLITLICLLTPVFGQTANGLPAVYAKSSQLIPLADLLDQLSEHHGINVVYNSGDLTGKSGQRPASWQEKPEQDLERLLNRKQLTFNKVNPRTYLIVPTPQTAPVTAAAVTKAPPAKIQVGGSVTDAENGDPLIGVSVLEKGTQNGVITDFNGSFQIEVEQGATLSFRYLGYMTKDVKVLPGRKLDIQLDVNATQLDEVVLIGYGTQKRSDVTGSLSSVSEEELKALPVTGLDQALQGRAAGVQVTQNSGAPGGAVSIRIRGIGSTLSAEPLYVIDGIPVINDNVGSSQNFSELDGGGQYSNALNTINPNDIESIEVLKDASATAIYGARAANGVVLISTKRGKSGKSKINLETYYGTQEISRKLPVMNLVEYVDYYNDVSPGQPIEEFANPALLGNGTDWQDAIYRNAATQNIQLSITGGSDRTQFALSGGYNNKDGVVIGSNFKRYSAKINLDHQFSDKIRLGNSLLVARTNERIVFNDNSNGVVYTALLFPPNAPVRNADGTFAGPQEEITLSFDNPVARALETEDNNEKTRVLANFYVEADLFSFLKYRTEVGTDLNFSNHHTFFPSFERGNFFGQSGLRKNTNNSFFWINKHLLTFNKQLGEKTNITLLGGFEAQAGKYEFLAASRNNLPNNQLQEINLGDAGQQTTGGGAGHWALVSYFGRANYSFDDRYLLTATFRADGSSRFGPSNSYGFFPSAAFAWRVSSESFLRESKVINNLKLRVGVGSVGNQEIGLYSYLGGIRGYDVVLGNQQVSAFGPDNIPNPNVRWETSFQTNIGIDLGLWNNRLEIIADVYRKEALGMLLPALLPDAAGGFNPPFVNIGEITNSGVELTVNTVNTKGKVEWQSGLNVSINDNVVKKLGSNGALIGVLQRIPVTRTEEGRAIGQFYGYQVEGIFQSVAEVNEAPFQAIGTRAGDIRFKDLNNDGIINDEDQTFIGNPIPDFTANLSNTFKYRGFDLNILLQSVFGNEILNLIRRDLEGFQGAQNQLAIAADRYTTANPSATIPRADGNDPNANRRVSDRFIEDGSFIRLRNLSLGYNLPALTIKKLNMTSLRVYVSAQNLFTITDYSGYDPEIGSFNQNPLINGVENGRYPAARSFTFGLNLGF